MKKGLRRRVAREAARRLYHNLAEEYKQAKEAAARSVGVGLLPSNREVASELDLLASEVEGCGREQLLGDLRREALQVMERLKVFHPRLIGSVWRGTARKGSDIDIEVFCQDTEAVVKEVAQAYQVTKIEQGAKTDAGKTERFLHVYVTLPSEHAVEVVIKGLARRKERRTCEIYGDLIVGLTLPQLRRLLTDDPQKRFLPKER
jgi:predicted nucleotidyltransferase